MVPYLGGRFEWAMKCGPEGNRVDGTFVVHVVLGRKDRDVGFDLCIECLKSVVANGRLHLDATPTHQPRTKS